MQALAEKRGYGDSPRQARALRELLAATLEWEISSAPPRSLECSGERFRIVALTGSGRRDSVLCEAAPGLEVPEYAARRAIRVAIGAADDGRLTIFTDASHSALVWTWASTAPSGLRLYRERSVRPGQAWGPLRPLLSSLGDVDPRPMAVDASGGARAVADALHDGSAADDPRQEVVDRIQSAADATELRGWWRRLASVLILDDRCDDRGKWLVNAMEMLVDAREAALERMASEVDDLDRRRERPRRTRLGDLRRLVARGGGRRDTTERRRFVRELVALWNVVGVAPDDGRARATRLRVARAAELPPQALAASIRAAPRGGAAPGPSRTAELRRVGAARALIRSTHLAHALENRELARAGEQLAARLQRLAAPASVAPETRATLVRRSRPRSR